MSDEKMRKIIGSALNEFADTLEGGRPSSQRIKVGVTLLGSEHGIQNVLRGAERAQKKDEDIEVKLIGPKMDTYLDIFEVGSEEEQYERMEKLIDNGEIHGAVTMHYNFPIGVSTVGRVITPGRGKEMYIATTTGTTSTHRVEGMVLNAINGIITAKVMGIKNPTLGLLNVDGARQVGRVLHSLASKGYEILFANSMRENGDFIMRGNDLLTGTPDVMVTDTLTGNLLMKVFSSYTSGGGYESLGYGYGPGIGEGYQRCILIVSRASGEPVIDNAISFAGKLIKGNLSGILKEEYGKANRAGLKELLKELKKERLENAKEEATIPPKEIVTEAIAGIDIMELDEAVESLWKKNIYAESGMGCTGPIIMVSDEKCLEARELLEKAGYIEG